MTRYLIVNADDFGMSPGINRGILQACREGIVSSAGLMVHGPAARQAAACAHVIDLGLHIDLGEWVYHNGQWTAKYERASLDDPAAVERELIRQLEMFEELVGRPPSHIDSHQHVHLREPALTTARQIARELGVPLRSASDSICYCGAFYGQSAKGVSCGEAISAAALKLILAELPPGVTELSCHPGCDPGTESTYGLERELEVRTLCDPSVKRCLRDYGITLVSFRDVVQLVPTPRRNDLPTTGASAERRHARTL